jgi:hypothetical protein
MECGDKLKKNASIMGRFKTTFSGLFLTALGAYLLFQDLILPLKSGVHYGRRGRETLQEQEPVWFWLQTIFEGGLFPFILISIGLFFLISGLHGKGKVASVSVEITPRWWRFF